MRSGMAPDAGHVVRAPDAGGVGLVLCVAWLPEMTWRNELEPGVSGRNGVWAEIVPPGAGARGRDAGGRRGGVGDDARQPDRLAGPGAVADRVEDDGDRDPLGVLGA